MMTMEEARRVKTKRGYLTMGMTALYRLYDEAGDLLYVGVTGWGLSERFNGHSRVKPWWGDVAGVEVEWFTPEWRALQAERRAIRSEGPRFNIRSANSGSDPERVTIRSGIDS